MEAPPADGHGDLGVVEAVGQTTDLTAGPGPRARRRQVAWFIGILVSFVVLWEAYKVVGKALGTEWPIRPDDTSMPHTWTIVGALFERRRPSDPILLVVLLRDALFTLREAVAGFIVGSAFGFFLSVAFARSRLLERGLMPYVIASQTVPLIAIAPMIVAWGGRLGWPNWIPAALIAAYLSFFPVTINTLRGLRSPQPTSLELMRSYAATPRETLWKLQVPAALPFIFTALKVAATASVIGALVGELPSALNQGLGRALLTFTYTFITSPEKLFAAIIISALLGLAFVGTVVAIERRVLARFGQVPL